MQENANRYEFERVEELLILDDRQIEDCAKCLVEWVKAVRKLQLLYESNGLAGFVKFDGFVWIDDGKNELSRIEIKLGE